MLIRAVIVGIDHWDDLTKPFADSLGRYNPSLKVTIIDNASEPPYPDTQRVMRIDRCGYGAALNAGAHGSWDWLLCCNNDCLCSSGDVLEIIKGLRTDTIYGNAWKFDYEWMADLHLPAVVDSAYFLIPHPIWDTIGGFDPEMDAAFEEIDYGLRAIAAGFRLDVAELPITHLNMHTRRELEGYEDRWRATSKSFHRKHLHSSAEGETL
jgi:GT2 family glycosyltransferase